MNKIEMLYAGKTINELLQEVSANDLINEFGSYLKKIVVVGVMLEGDILARARYLDEKTTDLTIELIKLFGTEYQKEIILLLAEQEYTLLNRICDKYNLFKYLVQEMETVQGLIDENVYKLVSSVFRNNSEQIYGKKVYNSFGNRGDTYYGFVNDLYSNNWIKNGVFGVDFQLLIEVFSYKTIELGRKLGVKEVTLERLEKANEHTHFLELPKHRKTGLVNLNKFQSRHTVGFSYEKEFKIAFIDFVKELNQIISKEYPTYLVKHSEYFETRGDVDTDFYISIEKRVDIQNDYDAARLELIEAIKTFNKIENQFFAIDDMHKDLVDNYKERSERVQPLFEI